MLRLIFGVLSLVITLLIAGFLVKSQFDAKPVLTISKQNNSPNTSAALSEPKQDLQTQTQQIRQIEEQVRQSLEAARQRPEKLPSE